MLEQKRLPGLLSPGHLWQFGEHCGLTPTLCEHWPLLFLILSGSSFLEVNSFLIRTPRNVLLITWGYVLCRSLRFPGFAALLSLLLCLQTPATLVGYPDSQFVFSTQGVRMTPSNFPALSCQETLLRQQANWDSHGLPYFPFVMNHCSLYLNSSVMKTIVLFIPSIVKKSFQAGE